MSLLNPKTISTFCFLCKPELPFRGNKYILHLKQKALKCMTFKQVFGGHEFCLFLARQWPEGGLTIAKGVSWKICWVKRVNIWPNYPALDGILLLPGLLDKPLWLINQPANALILNLRSMPHSILFNIYHLLYRNSPSSCKRPPRKFEKVVITRAGYLREWALISNHVVKQWWVFAIRELWKYINNS